MGNFVNKNKNAAFLKICLHVLKIRILKIYSFIKYYKIRIKKKKKNWLIILKSINRKLNFQRKGLLSKF